MIDYGKKGHKIAFFAMVLALITFSIAGIPGQNGINGSNGTSSILGTLTFVLHNTSSDVTLYNSLKMDSVIVADVNKTQRTYSNIPNGDIILQNWTSLSMNLTLIPAGAILLHLHASKSGGTSKNNLLWFDVGIVNSTGGNFSSVGLSLPTAPYLSSTEQEIDISGVMLERIVNLSDRLALRVYSNQSGGGANPDITLYQDDFTVSRLTIPAIPIDLTSLINQVNSNTIALDTKMNITDSIVASGNYTGNGSTNRQIPYSLNRKASKIDIFSDSEPIAIAGSIIVPGKIINYKDGGYINVNNHTSSAFYVSGTYNNPVSPPGVVSYELGNMSQNEYGYNNLIMYQPFIANVTGNSINTSINIFSAVGNGRMALYSDNANTPYQLLNESINKSLANGWNNFTVVTSIDNGSRYWIAFQVSDVNTYIYRNGSIGAVYYTPFSYSNFPTVASSTNTETHLYNVRVAVNSVSETKYYWVAI